MQHYQSPAVGFRFGESVRVCVGFGNPDDRVLEIYRGPAKCSYFTQAKPGKEPEKQSRMFAPGTVPGDEKPHLVEGKRAAPFGSFIEPLESETGVGGYLTACKTRFAYRGVVRCATQAWSRYSAARSTRLRRSREPSGHSETIFDTNLADSARYLSVTRRAGAFQYSVR